MFPEEEETNEAAEGETMRDIDFSMDDIKEAIRELDETSASGPDQFPSITGSPTLFPKKNHG